MLRRQPSFTLTAALTLGLGIGATTAIFSVVNAVLLRPLPYGNPDRVVIVWGDLRNRSVSDWPFSNPDFADLRAQATAFEGLAGLLTFRNTLLTENGETQDVRGAAVTTNIFSVLGLRMARGTTFSEADGTPPPRPAPPPAAAGAPAGGPGRGGAPAGGRGGPPPAPQAPQPQAPAQPAPPPPQRTILSYEFWQRHYNADESIIGRTAPLGPRTIEVVGVLEPGAQILFPPGTSVETKPDLWTPLRVDFTQGNRNNVGLRVVGRLKPGVSVERAQGEVDRIAADLRRQFAIKETAGLHFRVEPMGRDLVADVRPAILALMGAVGFVLLIACANVGNLLLARSTARERELAVRAALGAGRWRLVRQMLAESLLLAGCGAIVGLLVAQLGIRLLLQLKPDNLPRIDDIAIDPAVLAFTALATVVSAVTFGLIPAISSARANVIDMIRKTGRSGGIGAGKWLRNGVVVAEVVLSFVLLIGSGLMFRSFVAIHRIDPGFDPAGVLTFRLNTSIRFTGPEDALAFLRDAMARLRGLPGVLDVTSGQPLPLDGGIANARWGTEAAAADPSKFQQANLHMVYPGYFKAMRTPIVEGREFTDAENRRDALFVVIDTTLARKAFPGQSAVGKRMLARIRTDEPETFEIIGVVKHQRHNSLIEEGREAMFFATGVGGGFGRVAVRVQGDPLALVPTLRAELARMPGSTYASEIEPMSAFVDRASARTRFSLVLIAVFAGIAVVLAIVGLYGVLSTLVRQRTAEIGVRMALGAGRRSVFNLVVGQGLKLSLIGIAVGLGAAFLLTQVLQTMLVSVSPTDPVTFVAISVLFLAVAAAACAIPAVRAARLDPTAALRDE
jgi:putative ABC transport system permease protein